MNVTTLRNGFQRQYGVSTQSDEMDLLVANALRMVVENVFINQSNTFIFTISNTGYAVDVVINRLLALTGFIAVQLIVLENNVKYTAEDIGSRYCHLIIIDSLKSLVDSNIVQYRRNRNSLEYYFMFLKTHDTKINREMKLIFRYCYDNYWLNCNVMVQSNKGEVLVYSYFPFKANNCFQTEPVLINQFKHERFVNREIFPNKLLDLHGCALKISTWHTPPFVANYRNKRFPGFNVTGFEMITLTHISRLMNFSLAIEWISFGKNQSPEAALLEKLKNYETNITLGVFRKTTDFVIKLPHPFLPHTQCLLYPCLCCILSFAQHFYLLPPTLTGLAEEGYRAVATEVTAEFLLQVPEIANKTLPLIITNSSSEMSPMRFMEFHRNESLVAMSTNEFALRYVREELTFRTVIRVLPIDIKEQHIGFYLTKHSYLIDRFNDYVLRLHASGCGLRYGNVWTNSNYRLPKNCFS
ncbi:hypothetical protein DOY81_011708 [Sarcophaga bullata]|nr:hypothetical protein DOY81_011708 [Sarcophaga bullata]